MPTARCGKMDSLMRRFAIATGVVSLLLLAADAAAAVYRYVDDRGVIHFTDAPDDARYQRIQTDWGVFAGRQRPQGSHSGIDPITVYAVISRQKR